ncbi:MAG TPA: FHA domain-containing protein [Gemmatimonadales bacterium]
MRSGPHAGTNLPVTGAIASVGADPANNVIIAGVDVAPRHGQFRLRGGVWTFSNFGSPGATLVDGEPVHGDAVLAPGSALQLGQVQVAFAPEDQWRDSTIERYADDPIPAAMMPVASSSIWSRVWFSLALCALLVAVYFLFRTI